MPAKVVCKRSRDRKRLYRKEKVIPRKKIYPKYSREEIECDEDESMRAKVESLRSRLSEREEPLQSEPSLKRLPPAGGRGIDFFKVPTLPLIPMLNLVDPLKLVF